ncbi:hypothetical protein A0256_15875 [Mucilaginibacter sp. PAMC 26640]|nr:hypothetical protein A0256_15875 [Mucilaginibacter sp. PAMC 26640]
MGENMTIKVANAATLKAWGKAADVIGLPLIEALPELASQPFLQLKRSVYETGVPYHAVDQRADLEIRGQLKSFYFNFSYQPYKDEEGNTVGVFCYATDVTELVLARNGLDEGKRILYNLIMQAPVGICTLKGSPLKAETVNDAFLALAGKNRSDFEKKPFWEVMQEAAEFYQPIADEVMSSGIAYQAKTRQVTIVKNGREEQRIIDFVYEPIRNDFGLIDGLMMIGIDLTEMLEAEEKSAKLAAIVDSTGDAIISKTLKGVITSWNKAAEKMFGYTSGEMIGQSVLHLIPTDRVDEETAILQRLHRGEQVDHFDTKRITKSGDLVDVSLTISPIRDKSGQIIGISKIARNITEKKQEEQRKNDFITIASHELKTPLTSVKTNVQMLLMKAKQTNDEFTLNFLGRADKQIVKMTTLIQNFLDNAQILNGHFVLNKQQFDVYSFLEEVIVEARLFYPFNKFILQAKEAITVVADKSKIAQVLENLISNAVKYSEKDSTIIIACENIGNHVKISVIDEGIGIGRLDQERLFERFYRVNNDRIKHVSGFGIGLFLVAEILQYHQAKIKLHSTENVGSTFYFELPLIEPIPAVSPLQ